MGDNKHRRIKGHKAGPGKPKGTKHSVKKYRLMMMFLFGRQLWIERTGSTVRMPVPLTARHLGCTKKELREYLYELENMGFMERIKWNRHWLTAKPYTPMNMAEIVEVSSDEGADVVPSFLLNTLDKLRTPEGAEELIHQD